MIIALLVLILFAILFPGFFRAVLSAVAIFVICAIVYGETHAKAYDEPNMPREQRIIHDLDEILLAMRGCGAQPNNAILGPFLRSKFGIPKSDKTTLGPEAQRIASAMAEYEEQHEGIGKPFCADMRHRYGIEGIDAPGALDFSD